MGCARLCVYVCYFQSTLTANKRDVLRQSTHKHQYLFTGLIKIIIDLLPIYKTRLCSLLQSIDAAEFSPREITAFTHMLSKTNNSKWLISPPARVQTVQTRVPSGYTYNLSYRGLICCFNALIHRNIVSWAFQLLIIQSVVHSFVVTASVL